MFLKSGNQKKPEYVEKILDRIIYGHKDLDPIFLDWLRSAIFKETENNIRSKLSFDADVRALRKTRKNMYGDHYSKEELYDLNDSVTKALNVARPGVNTPREIAILENKINNILEEFAPRKLTFQEQQALKRDSDPLQKWLLEKGDPKDPDIQNANKLIRDISPQKMSEEKKNQLAIYRKELADLKEKYKEERKQKYTPEEEAMLRPHIEDLEKMHYPTALNKSYEELYKKINPELFFPYDVSDLNLRCMALNECFILKTKSNKLSITIGELLRASNSELRESKDLEKTTFGNITELRKNVLAYINDNKPPDFNVKATENDGDESVQFLKDLTARYNICIGKPEQSYISKVQDGVGFAIELSKTDSLGVVCFFKDNKISEVKGASNQPPSPEISAELTPLLNGIGDKFGKTNIADSDIKTIIKMGLAANINYEEADFDTLKMVLINYLANNEYARIKKMNEIIVDFAIADDHIAYLFGLSSELVSYYYEKSQNKVKELIKNQEFLQGIIDGAYLAKSKNEYPKPIQDLASNKENKMDFEKFSQKTLHSFKEDKSKAIYVERCSKQCYQSQDYINFLFENIRFLSEKLYKVSQISLAILKLCKGNKYNFYTSRIGIFDPDYNIITTLLGTLEWVEHGMFNPIKFNEIGNTVILDKIRIIAPSYIIDRPKSRLIFASFFELLPYRTEAQQSLIEIYESIDLNERKKLTSTKQLLSKYAAYPARKYYFFKNYMGEPAEFVTTETVLLNTLNDNLRTNQYFKNLFVNLRNEAQDSPKLNIIKKLSDKQLRRLIDCVIAKNNQWYKSKDATKSLVNICNNARTDFARKYIEDKIDVMIRVSQIDFFDYHLVAALLNDINCRSSKHIALAVLFLITNKIKIKPELMQTSDETYHFTKMMNKSMKFSKEIKDLLAKFSEKLKVKITTQELINRMVQYVKNPNVDFLTLIEIPRDIMFSTTEYANLKCEWHSFVGNYFEISYDNIVKIVRETIPDGKLYLTHFKEFDPNILIALFMYDDQLFNHIVVEYGMHNYVRSCMIALVCYLYVLHLKNQGKDIIEEAILNGNFIYNCTLIKSMLPNELQEFVASLCEKREVLKVSYESDIW